MQVLRLLGVYFRLSVLDEVQYRANFALQVIQSALELATGLAGLALVFQHTPRLAGWTQEELLTVLGVYLVLGGVIHTLVAPNVQQMMEDVREGSLDHTLIRPADGQLLVSIRRFQIWKLVDVAIGVVVIAVSIGLRAASVGWAEAAAFALALVSGGVIVYSLWFGLACTAFWFVRVWSVMDLLEGIYIAGRWPVGIYPGWMRLGLTFLVPVGFAVTMPAEALTGRWSPEALALVVGLAIAALVGARGVWRLGLRNYSGASA